MLNMPIDKAIEILSDSANSGMTTFNADYKQAQIMGIDALLRVKAYRETHLYIGLMPLKGELLP